MKWFPVILIGLGVGFLLYNLQIISFTPWSILWPILIIWFAADQLFKIAKRQRGKQNSWDIVLWLIVLTVGVYMLLPAIGIPTPAIPWKIVWPLGLVLVGLLILLPGNLHWVKVELDPGNRKRDGEFKSSFIGEFNRGPSDWVLDDLEIRQGIGEINLDLTQAIVPDREVYIDILGYVGEISIYLPPGLPVKINCSLNIGEISVLNNNESGFHRQLQFQSDNYENATQKVNINAHWKIGEINIRQIR